MDELKKERLKDIFEWFYQLVFGIGRIASAVFLGWVQPRYNQYYYGGISGVYVVGILAGEFRTCAY